MSQQTAVEWFYQRILAEDIKAVFEQAKAMEKEQMGKCYNHGSLSLLDMGHGDSFEDYYNKNYNK